MTSGVVGGVGGSRKIACMRVRTEDFGILFFAIFNCFSVFSLPTESHLGLQTRFRSLRTLSCPAVHPREC